jgi:hypothetical protein
MRFRPIRVIVCWVWEWCTEIRDDFIEFILSMLAVVRVLQSRADTALEVLALPTPLRQAAIEVRQCTGQRPLSGEGGSARSGDGRTRGGVDAPRRGGRRDERARRDAVA